MPESVQLRRLSQAGFVLRGSGTSLLIDAFLSPRLKFNGVDAGAITVITPNKIEVTVPVGATTGPIVVETPLGDAASKTPFAVLP